MFRNILDPYFQCKLSVPQGYTEKLCFWPLLHAIVSIILVATCDFTLLSPVLRGHFLKPYGYSVSFCFKEKLTFCILSPFANRSWWYLCHFLQCYPPKHGEIILQSCYPTIFFRYLLLSKKYLFCILVCRAAVL